MTDIGIERYCRIRSGRVTVDGVERFPTSFEHRSDVQAFLSDIYASIGIDYRKFFKMDLLAKTGFLAAELLMDDCDRETPKGDAGIVLFNRRSSLEADAAYQATIGRGSDDYFPSPANFVYTLPNIVTGEIAIRHRIHGETAFYVLSQPQNSLMADLIADTIRDAGLNCLLAGWIEVEAETDSVDCLMMRCRTAATGGFALSPQYIEHLLIT